MKKKVFLVPLALFMTAGTVMVAGCGEKKPDPVVVQTLDSISVTKLPTKLEYNAGDTFDPTGLEVTAKYSDGSTKVLTGTDYTLNPTQNLQAGTSKISVSYEEGGVTKNAEIAITVHSVTPPPVEKVLDSISVVKGPDKTEYVEGDTFDPTGMEVKAIYDDGSDKVLTGVEYTISPTQNLAVGTDHVTITYEEGGVTKTADVAITVNGPVIPTNYGTEDNPLSVTEAIAILEAECINDNDMTKQAITAIGTIKNIRKTFDYDKDGKDDCFELDLTDETNDIYIYRVHATPEIAENIALNSTLKFVGFAKNYKGTLEFVDNGNEHQCTALSAVKSSKVAVSISDVVGPSEVALNGSIAVSEVTLTVNYDDESKVEGQHPDSIDLDTSEAGDKVATVHYGELTGTFNVTVKNEESPNQFVAAYEAAAALESGKTTTESYNFKGIVVAKRGTEYYVQHEGYGLDVYNPSTAPAIGDLVEVNSTMKNYNGTLETGTINKFAILKSDQELPAAAEVTSSEVLGNLKQNILANVAGTAKEDITTIDTSKDYTLALMVGTDEIPVFIKKAALATLKDKLVGVKAGDAISITGAVTGEFKGTKQVLVVDGSTVNIPRPVSSVAFEEEAYSVLVGETVTVKANVLPEDADDKVVSYSLANASEGVEATIDAETGVVTAGAVAGTVEVVATAHGDSTKTTSVTLTISSAAIPVTGVTLDKETMTIEMKGEAPWTDSLTATVAPADATDRTYVFSSSDETVATVNDKGVVTAVAKGTCDIIVTTTDGSFTDTCHVSVIEEQPILVAGNYFLSNNGKSIHIGNKEQNVDNYYTKGVDTIYDGLGLEFELVTGSLNQYKISVKDSSPKQYLYDTSAGSEANCVRFGTSEAAINFVWTLSKTDTGTYHMSANGRNLSYRTASNDFRMYTNFTQDGCAFDFTFTEYVAPTEINVTGVPETVYVGEELDLSGVTVTAKYGEEDKVITNYNVSKTGLGTVGTGTITFKFAGLEKAFEVTVAERILTSIEIVGDMATKEYGELDTTWNFSGLTITAHYEDGSENPAFDVNKVVFTANKTPAEVLAAGDGKLIVTAKLISDELKTDDIEISNVIVTPAPHNKDVITTELMGMSGSYADYSKTIKGTGITYAGNLAVKAESDGSNSIQIKSGTVGLYTVNSNRIIKSIELEFGLSQSDAGEVNVYGSNNTFSSSYVVTDAEKLNSSVITKASESKIITMPDGSKIRNFLIKSNKNATYLKSVTVLYEDSIVENAVDSVTLDKNSADLYMGNTLQLNATVKGIGDYEGVSWSSSDATKATVVDGLVTPVEVTAADTPVIITATSTKDATVKAECFINVKASRTLTGIVVDGTMSKVSYVSNETWDFAGLTVSESYSDESTELITDSSLYELTADKTVAEFIGESTDPVTGNLTITAKLLADPTKTATITVAVTVGKYNPDAPKTCVFDKDNLYGLTTTAGKFTLTNNDGLTIEISNGVFNSSNNDIRIYKGATIKFTASKEISKIEFTCTGTSNGANQFGETAGLVVTGGSGVWSGNTQSITFTASGAQVRCTSIVITYK